MNFEKITFANNPTILAPVIHKTQKFNVCKITKQNKGKEKKEKEQKKNGKETLRMHRSWPEIVKKREWEMSVIGQKDGREIERER